ncbi:MAG: ABC transporter ATP-binding protein [Clostridia bacterium]
MEENSKTEFLNSEYAVEMRNITKLFPGIVANDNVTLQLKKGEIHALLGENGAGKSTLMSVLFGLYQAEEGEIFVYGKKVDIKDPNDANELGIGMVHQHFKLVDVYSVVDNIILGCEPTKCGFIAKKLAEQKIIDLCQKYNMPLNPDALIENLTVGQQQKVEILKMLYRNNEILIFDEPTAVLTPQEIEELLGAMKDFASQGKSILFITHKLNEIMAVADRCTILRKGKCVGTVNIKDTDKQQLSKLMVGRDVEFSVHKEELEVGEEVLTVNNLQIISQRTKKHVINDVSFAVGSREIVAIAGIEGNGQSELVYAISGITGQKSGDIKLCNVDITHSSVRVRNNLGLTHIPEDRHKYGLILDFSLEDNLILKDYFTKEFCNRFGFMRRKNIRKRAETLIAKFDIRSGQGSITPVRSMSGGNQQKAILAREISLQPKLLVAVQPTRGLDVGSIEFIHSQIVKARKQGCAVLLVSYELDEVMNLADRILVIYEGEIVAELNPKTTSVQEIGLYMSGSKKNIKEAINE